MNDISAADRLDSVLRLLDTYESETIIIYPEDMETSPYGLKGLFLDNTQIDFTRYQAQLLLDKLISDGYIASSSNINETCSITFDGKLFIQNGGYKNQIEVENQRLTIISRTET